jgi:hypothetical protein
MKWAVSLLLMSTSVMAAPKLPEPKLPEVLAGSLTNKARIRFSKVVEGQRVTVTITGGVAERVTPSLSPEPKRLPYNLDRNRELERQVKATKLGSQSRFISEQASDRTLEILAEGDNGFVVVGKWSMPLKTWKKRYSQLLELLEPLFDVQMELFQPQGGPEK